MRQPPDLTWTFVLVSAVHNFFFPHFCCKNVVITFRSLLSKKKKTFRSLVLYFHLFILNFLPVAQRKIVFKILFYILFQGSYPLLNISQIYSSLYFKSKQVKKE